MLSRLQGLHLDLEGGEPYKLVEIQPVVIFSILDQYLRREKDSDRVVGTLMGTIDDGTVCVNNCFTVPHTEGQTVAFNLDIHRQRIKLHHQIYPEEQVVGWYSTYKKDPTSVHNSNLLNEFYGREMNDVPTFLVVDPTLVDNELGIRCYYGHGIQFSDRVIQQQFRPLRHTLKTYQAERLALERLIQDKEHTQTSAITPLSDLDSLSRTLKDLVSMLDRISAYVNSVVKGETKGSSKIGRLIDDTLSLLPLDPTQFQNLFTKGLQDILMVVYLANLTKTHLILAQNSPNTD
jgi:translation initiation factor 3 subunit F